MKKYTAIIALTLSLLAGCDGGRKEAEQRAYQATLQRQQAEMERQKAERERDKAKEGMSMWQTVATVVGISAFVLLIIGTAIGSSARKDAEKTKKDE